MLFLAAPILLISHLGLAVSALLPWERDKTTGYGTLETQSMYNGSVLRVGIINPPLNLYDAHLNLDILSFLGSLEKAGLASDKPNSPPKVVIFHSKVPEFFMWYLDVNYFVPGDSPYNATERTALFDDTAKAVHLLRSLPTIFIAEVNGRASGSGDEFLLQCDMSFVGPDAILSNPEAALGGFAGNGGTEYLVRALGIQRASEYLLGVLPVTGADAAQLGWVNRAFPTAQSLTNYVNGLAERISYINAAPLNATKTSLRAFGPSPQQVQTDLTSLSSVVKTQVSTFRKEIALAANYTKATAWTLDMFKSLKDIKLLHPHN